MGKFLISNIPRAAHKLSEGFQPRVLVCACTLVGKMPAGGQRHCQQDAGGGGRLEDSGTAGRRPAVQAGEDAGAPVFFVPGF